MKVIKVLLILILIYVGVVVLFESLLGYYQPADARSLTITVLDEDGAARQRVLARIESDDALYVAANHWPRAWYRQALANPNVQITDEAGTADYLAVPVTGQEHERVNAEHALGPVIRILTGFPPRYFLRLEPR